MDLNATRRQAGGRPLDGRVRQHARDEKPVVPKGPDSVRGTPRGTVPWAAAREVTLKARACVWQPVPHGALGCVAGTDRKPGPPATGRSSSEVANHERAPVRAGRHWAKRQNEANQRIRSDWAASAPRSRDFAAYGRAEKVANHKKFPCCLTFDMRGPRRCGPAKCNMLLGASRGHAGGGPLDGRVSRHRA